MKTAPKHTHYDVKVVWNLKAQVVKVLRMKLGERKGYKPGRRRRWLNKLPRPDDSIVLAE